MVKKRNRGLQYLLLELVGIAALGGGCVTSRSNLSKIQNPAQIVNTNQDELARRQEQDRKERELREYRQFAQDIFDNPENPGEFDRKRTFERGERVYEVNSLDFYVGDNLESGKGKIGWGDALEIVAYQRTPRGLKRIGRIQDNGVDFPVDPFGYKRAPETPENETFESWMGDIRSPERISPQESLAQRVKSEGYQYDQDKLGRKVYVLNVPDNNVLRTYFGDKQLKRVFYFAGSEDSLALGDRLDFEFRDDTIAPYSPLGSPRTEIDINPLFITETYSGRGKWSAESCGLDGRPGWQMCLAPVDRDIDTSSIYASLANNN